MASYRNSRFFSIALVLIVIAIAIVGLVYLAQIIFFPGSKGNVPQIETSQANLTNTSADRSVSMTVRGRIVANEDFRSYQIMISPNQRVFTVYKSYLDQPIDNITLGNNTPAYEQFVYALNRAGLMNASELTGSSNDTRGICATGFLYEFQMYKSNKSIKKLWSTSCSRSSGSLKVNVSPSMNLFTVQIPGLQEKLSSVW